MQNGPSSEIDFDLYDDPSGTSDDHPLHPGASDRDLEEFFNSSGLSPAEVECALVDAPDEEDYGCSSWANAEFAEAALRGVPDPRKVVRGNLNQTLTRVTAEDFPPGNVRNSFIIIRHFSHLLVTKKTDSAERILAARWLFSELDSEDVSFELCCRTLNARQDVVRLRLMFELWYRWIVFEQPLPRVVVPVPEVLFDDIQYCANWPGHNLAQVAWEWPGIPTKTLLLQASGRETLEEVPEAYTVALSEMDKRHILSEHGGGWWLTGRNPVLIQHDHQVMHSQPTVRGKTVTFSELFD